MLKIAAGIIVFNGDFVLKQCLESIYPFVSQILVSEGPVTYWQEKGLLTSNDKTNEILDSFPDPEHKITITHGQFLEKDDQCRSYMQYLKEDTDYVWNVDSDEIYKYEDIDTLIKILYDHKYTSVGVKSCSFFGGFDRYIGGFEEEKDQFLRIFKVYPGSTWMSHRPPRIFNDAKIYEEYLEKKQYEEFLEKKQAIERELGHPTTLYSFQDFQNTFTERRKAIERKLEIMKNGKHLDSETLFNEYGVKMFHYSAVFPRQVYSKQSYYRTLAHGKFIEDYFNRVYIPWLRGTIGEQQAIEQIFQGVHEYKPEYRRPSFTKPFNGVHPIAIQNVLPDLKTEITKQFDHYFAYGRF